MNTYESWVRPAILELLAEQKGEYHSERDLHHHLTICLNRRRSLNLGLFERLIEYEHPTHVRYSWKTLQERGDKSGGIDMFIFYERPPGAPICTTPDGQRSGTALEINFNRRGVENKIKLDFIKLIDPRTTYSERVYFAAARGAGFLSPVQNGLVSAFQWVRSCLDSKFLVPATLRVIVAELKPSLLWEAAPLVESLPDEIQWTAISFPHTSAVARAGSSTA